MSRLLIFSFDREEEGKLALRAFRDLEKRGVVGLDDPVVLAKKADGSVTQYREHATAVLVGAATGAIVGSMLVFMLPVLSTLVGAAVGALIGRLSAAWRVDDEAVRDATAALRPGMSDLLIGVRTNDVASFDDWLPSLRAQIVRTSLPPTQEARLRQVLLAGS